MSDPLTHCYLKFACGLLCLILTFVSQCFVELQSVRLLMQKRNPEQADDSLAIWICLTSFFAGITFLTCAVGQREYLFMHH